MGEFFRGWRRKVGAVTLVMAVVFMVGWFRSAVFCDVVGYSYGKNASIYSNDASMGWFLVRSRQSIVIGTSAPLLRMPEWNTFKFACDSSRINWGERSPFQNPEVTPVSEWRGIALCRFDDENEQPRFWLMTIHYWFIVIPLTLLSAWLLLSKPRSSTQKKAPEPIHETVA